MVSTEAKIIIIHQVRSMPKMAQAAHLVLLTLIVGATIRESSRCEVLHPTGAETSTCAEASSFCPPLGAEQKARR